MLVGRSKLPCWYDVNVQKYFPRLKSLNSDFCCWAVCLCVYVKLIRFDGANYTCHIQVITKLSTLSDTPEDNLPFKYIKLMDIHNLLNISPLCTKIFFNAITLLTGILLMCAILYASFAIESFFSMTKCSSGGLNYRVDTTLTYKNIFRD